MPRSDSRQGIFNVFVFPSPIFSFHCRIERIGRDLSLIPYFRTNVMTCLDIPFDIFPHGSLLMAIGHSQLASSQDVASPFLPSRPILSFLSLANFEKGHLVPLSAVFFGFPARHVSLPGKTVPPPPTSLWVSRKDILP